MRILLDENFPLALLHNLRKDGLETEHIITIMSTAELLEKIQALPAPLQHRVEDFVEALAAQALAKPEGPFFARVEALRDQIRTEYGTFPGALSHLRELRDGTR